MNTHFDSETDDRYRHTSYSVGSGTVTMIEDRYNEYAWIQSSVTWPVRS